MCCAGTVDIHFVETLSQRLDKYNGPLPSCEKQDLAAAERLITKVGNAIIFEDLRQ
jgi:hypothetical protein